MQTRKKAKSGPVVVDLFSGAGGLSAGFRDAGFRVVGGIDSWKPACDSFALNERDALVRCGDIYELDAEEFKVDLGTKVDVVLGGPSCQGFSTSSGLSRKGRKVNDPRNSLFEEFVRFVDILSPSWIVMENVTGLLLYHRGAVARAICEEFARIGYHVVPMILLAADHGVPQLRRRLFFIGNNTNQPIAFPHALHGDPELWKDFALPFAHLSRIGNKTDNENKKPHVSLADALSDLPPMEPGEYYESQPYPQKAETAYQRRIRRYSRRLTLHETFSLSPSDSECVPLIGPGENWRSLPERIRDSRFGKIRPYDATTMLKRPLWEKPSHTITTKFNDASAGAFIHPTQDRTFSLREGARIQSFPDRYKFSGSPSQIRRLIGNAVPPLLAERIALAIAPEVYAATGMSDDDCPKAIPRLLLSEQCSIDDLLGLKESKRKHDRRQLALFDDE